MPLTNKKRKAYQRAYYKENKEKASNELLSKALKKIKESVGNFLACVR